MAAYPTGNRIPVFADTMDVSSIAPNTADFLSVVWQCIYPLVNFMVFISNAVYFLCTLEG